MPAYVLTLTGQGNYAGTRNVNVTVTDQVTDLSKATVKVSGDLGWKEEGATPTVTVTATTTDKRKITEILSSENEWTRENFKASFTNHNKVGKATVTIEPTDAGKAYFTGSKSATFSVKPVGKLGSVTGLFTTATYTGSEIFREGYAVYSVADKANETPLTESTDKGITGDYIVKYSSNINAGKATIVFEGINGYAGSKLTKTFTISKISLGTKTAQNPEVSVQPYAYYVYYDKSGAKPGVSVYWNSMQLEPGRDYTVKYSNNTTVTTESTSKLPTVTVTGKGNFTGTATATFRIYPRPLYNVSIIADDIIYSGKANKYSTKVTLTDYNGKKLQAGKDYESVFEYTLDDGTVLTSSSPALSPGTSVRVTVTGKGNYSETTYTYFRVLEKAADDISKASFKIADQEYTGSYVIPGKDDIDCTIGKAKTELTLGQDFYVYSYTNNVNKGTAKITFRGTGKYGGMKTVTFKITAKNGNNWWQRFLGE